MNKFYEMYVVVSWEYFMYLILKVIFFVGLCMGRDLFIIRVFLEMVESLG